MAVRVLHILHYLNRGGIENWLLDLAHVFDRRELAMDVCCRGPTMGVLVPEFQAAGAEVHHVPLTWNHADFGRRLGRLLREGNYDILHVHAGSFAGFPCVVAHRNNVGAVVTFHSTQFPFEVTGPLSALNWLRAMYTRRSFRTACREADSVLFCSQSTEDSIKRISRVTPDQRFLVIPNGTSKSGGRNPAARAEKRRELGIDPEVPVAIHVGGMKDPKNHMGLLAIADHVRKAIPHFRLLIVGDGLLRPKIERQIERLNLNSVATLLGSRGDVEQLLDASDVMIFPSLWEGLPIAVIEAQMKGLPVVGSDIGPLREATLPGRSSLLFPVEQEKEMADAVVGLLHDPGRRAEIGDVALGFAGDRFSIGANASRYLEIYRQVAALRSHPTEAGEMSASR